MFDIEKELSALGKIKHRPDETLRQRTLAKLRGKAVQPHKLRALRWAAVPAAAAVLAAILLLIALPGVQTASYYTIDINPSIGIETDQNGVILSAKAQNGDAEDLLADLDITGMPFIDALRCVVQAAEEQGYLKDNGHVLVAHFGVSAQVSEGEIETAVESSTHKQVNVLLLQGDKNDYQQGGSEHQSAGISLLMKNAMRLGIEDTDIETIIETVKKNNHANQGNGPKSSPSVAPSATETATPSASHGNGNGQNENNGNSGNHTGNSNQSGQGNGGSSNNGGNTDNGNHNGSENGNSGKNGSKENNGNTQGNEDDTNGNGHADKEDKPGGSDG